MKKLLLSLAILFGLGLMVAPALPAQALFESAKNNACAGITGTASDCGTTGNTAVGNLTRTIINLLSIAVGVVSVVMIIIGGFKLVTSGGDPAKAKSGRSTVIYALIGLAVAVLAQVLVNLVFTQASKVGSVVNAPSQTQTMTLPQFVNRERV